MRAGEIVFTGMKSVVFGRPAAEVVSEAAEPLSTKVVRHARDAVFQIAEVAVPQQLFEEILRLIAGLRPGPRPA